MPLPVSLLEIQGLRWLVEWGGEGEGAFARGLSVSYLVSAASCVSRNTSVTVARRGLIVASRDLPSTNFLQTFGGERY